MSKVLRRHVHVTNEDGATQVFRAGSTPAAWARKKITNPAAWADDTPAQADDDSGGDEPELPDDAPPRAGKGSGVDAWRTYATERFELDIAEDASRDDIVEAVAAAHAESDGS